MFCHNCGNQLPDNAQFCSSCGAKMASGTAAQQNTSAIHQTDIPRQNTAQKPAQQAPKKKKKTGILVTAAVMLVFYLIGHFAGNSMADSYTPSGNTGSQTGQSSMSSDNQNTGSDSSAYDKVFSDRFIVPSPGLLMTPDSDAYVHVDANGIVAHLQYGYKDDIVHVYVETVYYPLDTYDAQATDENVQSLYGNSGLDFVSLTTNFGAHYYSYTLTIRDLYWESNIQAAEEAGLLSMEGDGLWSMSATEADLLAQGYIKK